MGVLQVLWGSIRNLEGNCMLTTIGYRDKFRLEHLYQYPEGLLHAYYRHNWRVVCE